MNRWEMLFRPWRDLANSGFDLLSRRSRSGGCGKVRLLRLLETELTLADRDQKRNEILEMAVAEMLKVLEEPMQPSNITGQRADALEAEAAWLQAKINLLLERQRQQLKQATPDTNQQK